MKSLCIKTNNDKIIDYLFNKFENINLVETYITIKEFKHYTNIILHYKDKNITKFINMVSNILTKCIINFYEKNFIDNIINYNYFYFNTLERKKISYNTLELLNNYDDANKKYDIINNTLFQHLTNNHSLYLNGFVNFQIHDYLYFLNEKIDFAVNKFLIDKEYLEYVNILRLYINSESINSNTNHLHLIYKDKESIIINNNKEIISCNDNISKAKYISDISFSSNDLALNTLLNLLPKKITIHLTDEYDDEFINTLKLIFQERVIICQDCDICNIYKCRNIVKK